MWLCWGEPLVFFFYFYNLWLACISASVHLDYFQCQTIKTMRAIRSGCAGCSCSPSTWEAEDCHTPRGQPQPLRQCYNTSLCVTKGNSEWSCGTRSLEPTWQRKVTEACKKMFCSMQTRLASSRQKTHLPPEDCPWSHSVAVWKLGSCLSLSRTFLQGLWLRAPHLGTWMSNCPKRPMVEKTTCSPPACLWAFVEHQFSPLCGSGLASFILPVSPLWCHVKFQYVDLEQVLKFIEI